MVLKDLMLLHWWFCWVLAIGGSLKKPLILPPAHCTRQGFPGATRSSHAVQPFSLIAQCLWFSSSVNNWTRFLNCIIISLPAHKNINKIWKMLEKNHHVKKQNFKGLCTGNTLLHICKTEAFTHKQTEKWGRKANWSRFTGSVFVSHFYALKFGPFLTPQSN